MSIDEHHDSKCDLCFPGPLANVCYIWSEELIKECDRIPAVKDRASLVHELICAYKLHTHMKVVLPKLATYEELKEFHSGLYLDQVKIIEGIGEDYEVDECDEECGLGYDCEPVPRLYTLIQTLAGASVTAARCLTIGMCRIAINWCGGWHHAQRFQAEGFCYVNDIVLAIEKLRRKFPKVLYIDLDVHHGNGVEAAYTITNRVFTLSFHRYEPGFFPGSGAVDHVGELYGAGYACNVPYKDGINDEMFTYLFDIVFPMVTTCFEPDAIVVQCGADVLAGDPLGGANVTPQGIWFCLEKILQLKLPTLVLGGGGYVNPNAARLWTYLTAKIIHRDISELIPENKFFLKFAPTYELGIPRTLKKDCNEQKWIDEFVIDKIRENLWKYFQHADNRGKVKKSTFFCSNSQKPQPKC